MLSIKLGAKLVGLKTEILVGLLIIEKVIESYGFDTVITEGTGGQHMPNSLHYKGLAVDIRSKTLNLPTNKQNVIKEAKLFLGDEYDFIIENEDQLNEHFHLEFQPKG